MALLRVTVATLGWTGATAVPVLLTLLPVADLAADPAAAAALHQDHHPVEAVEAPDHAAEVTKQTL
jgi:hypothetical protein